MNYSYASPQVYSLHVSRQSIARPYKYNQIIHQNRINNDTKVGNSLSNSPIINRNKVQSRLSYLKKLFSYKNSVQNSIIIDQHKQNIQSINRSNSGLNQNSHYLKNHYRYASDLPTKEQINQKRFKQVSLHLQSKQNICPFHQNHSYHNSSSQIDQKYDSPQKYHNYKGQYVNQPNKQFQQFIKQNKVKKNKSDLYRKNNINQSFSKKQIKKSKIDQETIEIDKIQDLLKNLKSQIAKNHKRIVLQFKNLRKKPFLKGSSQKMKSQIRLNPAINGDTQVREYFNPSFYKKTRLANEQNYKHHRIYPKIVYENKSII